MRRSEDPTLGEDPVPLRSDQIAKQKSIDYFVEAITNSARSWLGQKSLPQLNQIKYNPYLDSPQLLTMELENKRNTITSRRSNTGIMTRADLVEELNLHRATPSKESPETPEVLDELINTLHEYKPYLSASYIYRLTEQVRNTGCAPNGRRWSHEIYLGPS